MREALSSHTPYDESEAKDILSRGCNGFMQKPFRIKELSKKIWHILEDRPGQVGKSTREENVIFAQ